MSTPLESNGETLANETQDHFREISRQLGIPTWALSCIGLVFCYFHTYYNRRRKPKYDKDPDSKVFSIGSSKIFQYFKKQTVSGSDMDLLYKDIEHLTVPEDFEFYFKRARLQYRLDYDFARQDLCVTILQADGLSALDPAVLYCDSYVTVQLLGTKDKRCETKVHRNSLNPQFNETFNFKIPYDQLLSKTLLFELHDFRDFSKKFLGDLRVSLRHVDLSTCYEEWGILQSEQDKFRELGFLCFSLRYLPEVGKLNIVILEAATLRKIKPNGLPHPYVKMSLENGGKCLRKKKTQVKKSTLNPFFNESFTFQIKPDMLTDARLVITVFNKTFVDGSIPMGKIILGLNTSGTELRHWSSMIASPHRPVAQWHALQEPNDNNNN